MNSDIYQLLGIVIPSICSLVGVLAILILKKDVKEVHKAVNSQMDKNLSTATVAAKAEGILEGKTTAENISTHDKLIESIAKAEVK